MARGVVSGILGLGGMGLSGFLHSMGMIMGITWIGRGGTLFRSALLHLENGEKYGKGNAAKALI